MELILKYLFGSYEIYIMKEFELKYGCNSESETCKNLYGRRI